MSEDAIKDRRFRLIMIDDQVIMNVFWATLQDYPRAVTLPVLKGIPEGATVLSVEHRLELRAFVFLLAHRSFDPMPPGALFASDFVPMDYIRIELPARNA